MNSEEEELVAQNEDGRDGCAFGAKNWKKKEILQVV